MTLPRYDESAAPLGPARGPRGPRGPARPRRVALDTGYLLAGLPLGVLGFSVTIVGLAAGLGLLVVGAGLVVLVGTAVLSRGLAHVERAQLRRLQGREAPMPAYLAAPADAGRWRRLLTLLRDPQSWLDVGYGPLGFVTGLVGFCVAVSWWGLAAGGLTYWFWQQWLPEDDVNLVELIGWGEGRRDESLLFLGIGVVALLSLPLVVRGCAVVRAGVAETVLSGRAGLQAEVRRVDESRTSARVAEADALRRLERDLHDGPQQRLVRLTIDLGRARKQLTDDPERGALILDEALAQARETVADLRRLSRGISPPLLVDRGLPAALEELLQRATVPTTRHLDLPGRLPAHVESAVYFVVSEALTNIAKHSGAARATLSVTYDGGRVLVAVRDDGVGGAHPAKGSGLAGLQQRLAGVDGALEVDSPDGGPTVVRASIPVADAR